MSSDTYFTEMLQWHRSMHDFNYDPVVDWALRLMERGIESENIVILASFSKPVDRDEIRPYISFALRELELEEKDGDGWIWSRASYLSHQILEGKAIRKRLSDLSELDHQGEQYGLKPFWDLHYAWAELDQIGKQWYIDDKDISLDNIEGHSKLAAIVWLDRYRSFLKTGTFILVGASATDWQIPVPPSSRPEEKSPLPVSGVKWYQFWK